MLDGSARAGEASARAASAASAASAAARTLIRMRGKVYELREVAGRAAPTVAELSHKVHRLLDSQQPPAAAAAAAEVPPPHHQQQQHPHAPPPHQAPPARRPAPSRPASAHVRAGGCGGAAAATSGGAPPHAPGAGARASRPQSAQARVHHRAPSPALSVHDGVDEASRLTLLYAAGQQQANSIRMRAHVRG